VALAVGVQAPPGFRQRGAQADRGQ
jgi:hypothetical protein